MARKPALCVLPPRHASRSNIAALTERRLFTRTCSSPPLPDHAVSVGLRCGTGDSLAHFPHHVVAVSFRCEKANTKPPRSFTRIDPMFARDSSGRSFYFLPYQEGVHKISYLVSLLKEARQKNPPRVKTLLPPARAPLQKTPTGSTGPASSSSTLSTRFRLRLPQWYRKKTRHCVTGQW